MISLTVTTLKMLTLTADDAGICQQTDKSWFVDVNQFNESRKIGLQNVALCGRQRTNVTALSTNLCTDRSKLENSA